MGDAPTPLLIVCEGSGQPTHPGYGGLRICSMCGATVESNGHIARLHTRQDILAMLERGDFDE